MKHEEIKELVFLHSIDELNETEIEMVSKHLIECEECKNAYDNYISLNQHISENQPADAPDFLLFQAREELFEKLYNEKYKQNTFSKIINSLRNLIKLNYKYSIVATSFFILGLSLTYFNKTSNSLFSDFDNNIARENFTNVKLVQNIDENGNLELAYEKVIPQTYKGNINDTETKELLAKALLSSDNPGVRIKTVNAFANEAEKNFVPDPTVKNALIDAIKKDKNPVVRRTALTVLTKYPFDDEIKQTLLYVLSGDNNSGMRVLAISFLSGMIDNTRLDKNTIELLNSMAEKDDNGSVRNKAANILQGIQN